MTKPPSKAEMMAATNAQSGRPNYEDEGLRIPFTSKNGDMDAPAYRYTNPRYWEYR